MAMYDGETLIRRKYRGRKKRFFSTVLLYVVFVCGLFVVSPGRSNIVDNEVEYHGLSRSKRDARDLAAWMPADEDEQNCTERAIQHFPDNFMSLSDTQHGGVVVHILIALYTFGALAIVCDDYFVQSLERICEDLGLQEDVAGATFMAAGSSAPELATSVIGVFVAKNDVGVGTIVGSAVFNILIIIGMCGLLGGMVIELTWYPMMRDCLFYLLSVIALIVSLQDGVIYWYEGLVMVVMYVIYVSMMYFNRRLETWSIDTLNRCRSRYSGEREPLIDPELYDKSVGNGTLPTMRQGALSEVDKTVSAEEETTFIEKPADQISEKDEYESPWDIPESCGGKLFWTLMLPVKALLYISVPNCRKPGVWRKLYPLTFIMSIVWISGYSYIMVWMVTIAGDALGVPDTVMGLTLLAAGTSVPDCMASVLVARAGFGDMAVSNSIGSNIFDVLICLGLPWLLDTTAVRTGETISITSAGLTYSSITLLSTILVLIVIINVYRWRLTKSLGVVCIVTYFIVISISCLYELNIFGDFNPPSCPR